jgi:hypothetical protein
VLVGAAGLMAVAAAVAVGLPAAQRVREGRGAALGALLGRAFRDGAAAVVASPLARQLAQLVALGGGFAALLFLGVAEAASVRSSDAALVALLSALRSAAQIATVVAQLFLAPWLLRRLGTGWALLVAPLFAVAGAAVVVASPSLLAVGVLSVVARALDQALETPAQKLLHTLLPPASRGRVVGFVEGLAKRSGGIAAGLVAALLVSQSAALGAALLASALAWLWAASRMARRLPALAVTPSTAPPPAAGTATLRAPPGARALEQLARELMDDGAASAEQLERSRRAAEVLVRLAADGHAVACGLLVRAAAARPAAPGLLGAATSALAHTPARKLVPAWRAALAACLAEAGDAPPQVRDGGEVVGQGEATAALLDALALCGGDAGQASGWLADPRPRVAFSAQQAASWASDPAAAIEAAGDELRHGDELRLHAAELLCFYAARALADRDGARAFAAGWQLMVVLRRELGSPALRARALEPMIRILERSSGTRTAELALLRAELALLARRALGGRDVAAIAELVAWVRVLGALASGDEPGALATSGSSPLAADDLSLVVSLLGDRDEELADAAEDAVRAIGVAATSALVQLAGYGRRAARDRAAALLREAPATDETLDQLLERELSALDETCLVLGAFSAAGGAAATSRAEVDALLRRRLDERAREIAHTVLLLVAARRRAPAVGTAAAQWRTARGRHERARALAVLDTTLPRPLAARVLSAVDERPALERARAVAQRTSRQLPSLAAAISAELRGADASSRRILLDSLPDLAAHRDALTSAAHTLASAADPHRLLRRLASPISSAVAPPEGTDMPSHVETLLVLSKVPLFADLTTRQLDELARKTTWRTVAPGQLIHSASSLLDALLIVVDAELTLSDRRFPPGAVVDELAWFAPRPLLADLLVTHPGRLLTLERAAFEDLSDDVPGLGAALTRALAERLRA